ncbi:PIG-L family deacetylase [Mumia sp. zg.B17]|uniref:sugar-binding protein n=1 Tax=Mumia sp. zg.B17 TaxID=2855446 RepID=UPI001C6EC1C6|nr:sugar-binding protein [Mumia sp. zg.B17]MBW9205316.1 PIG-L family deacetylase [Mumia sp. zg.B17]
MIQRTTNTIDSGGAAPPRWRRLATTSAAAALLGAGLVAGPAAAAPASSGHADRPSTGRHSTATDLDVLFVGAHPDDESGRLSTFGQWGEQFGSRVGVVTITRGEGGGNAVGPEEGPALGVIREREERAAVGTAGVEDVFNLDKVDFYYSVSAPLHQQAWDEEDTLERLVRIVRETRPDVVVTMTPAPTPGNHGGHQQAARLAAEAYAVAGDPRRFRSQITKEGLRAYAPDKLFLNSARGSGPAGSSCPRAFTPTDPTDDVYGVWAGGRSASGKTWALVEREAQRKYASQGWAGFPDPSTDPQAIGCDYFTQVASRVPFARGDQSAAAASPAAMLHGAVLQAPRGLPLGTGLELTGETVDLVPGQSVTLTARLTAPPRARLVQATGTVVLPEGWRGTRSVRFGTVPRGRTVTRQVTVTAPADAAPNTRALIGLDVRSGSRTGYTNQKLSVTPDVSGTQQLLPQVAEFEAWAPTVGLPQLRGLVAPVLTLPSGGSRTVGIDVTNRSDTPQSGTVTVDLPDGFATADDTVAYEDLAPGATQRVEIEVTNTDDTLPTSNEGGAGGDYAYTITTTSTSGSSTATAALELVPTAQVGETAAPTLDGTVAPGEYASTLDLSRRWEGDACTSPADCSATGYVTRAGDDLYVAAEVTDDVKSAVLAASDCKRHWRVDSLEVAIDPTGTSENTSTTFKIGALPFTAEGQSCAARDADNRQGPIGAFPMAGEGGSDETTLDPGNVAPGFEMASAVTAPYTGYVIEMKIPLSALPATVDPDRMGFNMFVYDSDTQDKAGQTRLGWSTWGGVQGDPYRWGRVELGGGATPQVETTPPTLDFPALDSLDSPQSVEQAVRSGVGLSGLPTLDPRRTARVVRATVRGGTAIVTVDVRQRGTAHLFAVAGADAREVGSTEVALRPGRHQVRIPVTARPTSVLLGFDPDRSEGTASSSVRVR